MTVIKVWGEGRGAGVRSEKSTVGGVMTPRERAEREGERERETERDRERGRERERERQREGGGRRERQE